MSEAKPVTEQWREALVGFDKPMTEAELTACTAMSARRWADEALSHEAHAFDRLVGEVRRMLTRIELLERALEIACTRCSAFQAQTNAEEHMDAVMGQARAEIARREGEKS